MDELEYIEIPDVCRICLARRGNVSVFETDDKDSEELLGYSVADRIMSFACVEIQANDDLPDKICSPCLKQINQAFKLKAQCEYADASLRELCTKATSPEEECQENLLKVSHTSNTFVTSDPVSEIESVLDVSVIMGEYSNAQEVQADNENDVSEEGIVIEPLSGNEENKYRTISNNTKKIYGRKNNTSDEFPLHVDTYKSLKQMSQSENVIACAECGEQFSNKKKMEEHGLLLPGHRPFSCEFCWRTFKRFSNMKEHEKMHSGVKQFLCSDCGELATGKKYHYCIALRDREAKGYSCDVCGKKFVSRTSLGTHKKRHESQSKFQCKECDKLYFSKQELERHLRVHFNIRPFNCPDKSCSLTFFSQGELNRHLRYHEGLKRFSCDKCGQKFFESGHLACHQRKHTGERPYTCRHCPKSFTDNSKLKRHLLAHKKSSAKKKVTPL